MKPADLRATRLRLGQFQLTEAKALGMAPSGDRTVRRWESGRTPISLRTAMAVAALEDGYGEDGLGVLWEERHADTKG
jgi:DNA-binding XRE family transcriptional regulator